MAGAFASRLPFLVAAAIVAAATADPIVETISNTGIFGAAYHDDNHLGVIPTLGAGLLLVLELLAVRCAQVWRSTASRARHRFIDVARDLARRPLVRELPLFIALQITALFVLESVEQFVAGGTLVGGLNWLGGPIAFSLAVHALIGVTCAGALGASMRAVVRAFASIADLALRFRWIEIRRGTGAAIALERRQTALFRACGPPVSRMRGRAPPRVRATT